MPDSDNTLKILIQLGVINADDVRAANELLAGTCDAAKDLSKQMGVVQVSTKDVDDITRINNSTLKEGAEKWGDSRREIREVGNEIGRATGISHLGGLALGGLAAAAFAAGKAIEFLKSTWDDIQEAIKGEIKVGLPERAAGDISAAATAWNQYAEARAKVIASASGAEGSASAEEKHLANELKLVHEVLAAEKEKALADLELHKGEMSPEAYNAAKENIGNIFGEAGTKADQAERRQQIANKEREAANLELEAQKKTHEASGIKAAPKAVAEANQKTLDENAASGEKAVKEIDERIAMIKRLARPADNLATEYEGVGGKFALMGDTATFFKRYGYNMDTGGALSIEETRRAQAQAQIDAARNYSGRESENGEKKMKLMEEAGTASGKAANLRAEVKTDSAFEAQQNSVDAHVASLHQAGANKIAARSQQTAAAVERFTAVTVGGFHDVHAQFINHQQQMESIRQSIRNLVENHRLPFGPSNM